MSTEEVESVIECREQLIDRLQQVVQLALQVEGKMLGIVAREMVNISNEMRDVGIKCVEKIIAWTFKETPPGCAPARYIFLGGEEYLCKMLHDLDFVSEKLPDKLRLHGNFDLGDPCFVSKHSATTAQRRAAVGATLVILDAVARQAAYNNSRASISRRTFSDSFNRSKSGNEQDESPSISPTTNRSITQHPLPFPTTKEHKKSANIRRVARNDLVLDDAEEQKRAMHQQVQDDSSEKRKKKHHNKKEINIFRGKYLYRRGDFLGAGAYANVYECDRQDGRRFAVKVFNLPSEDEDAATYEYRKICLGREIRLLKNMRHANILDYEESFVYKKMQTHIVMERMACTLMKVNIDRNPNAAIKVLDTAYMPQHGTSLQLAAYAVITQILSAVAYLHSNHVIHRDIKPENVLCTVSPRGFVVKLGDFGSARELPTAVESYPDLTNYVGSRCYRAPEVLGQNTSYGMHADIWAVGCTMSEFLIGSQLFKVAPCMQFSLFVFCNVLTIFGI